MQEYDRREKEKKMKKNKGGDEDVGGRGEIEKSENYKKKIYRLYTRRLESQQMNS
jgi:hypothetical protein